MAELHRKASLESQGSGQRRGQLDEEPQRPSGIFGRFSKRNSQKELTDIMSTGSGSQPVRMSLKGFSAANREKLARFDADGDGYIDSSEIRSMVNTLVHEKFRSKLFRNGIIVMALFTLLLLGSMFGLTWAVVKSLKDTKLRDGVLLTRGGDTVLAASADYIVKDGRLVSRSSPESGPLLTSMALFQARFTSNASLALLERLEKLHLSATSSKAEMLLGVLGVTRSVASDGSAAVHILTHLGTASLRGLELHLDADLGAAALNAGFQPSSTTSVGMLVLGSDTHKIIGGYGGQTGEADCVGMPAYPDSVDCWLG